MFHYAALCCLAAVAGCATMTESTQQQLLVQTIQDNREVVGAGCVLYNDAGRWFVSTPGRVMVRKSAAPLRIDCRKDDTGSADERVASKPNVTRWGNLVLTAGLGDFVDRDTGAGFDYPSPVLVILRKPASQVSPESAPGGAVIY